MLMSSLDKFMKEKNLNFLAGITAMRLIATNHPCTRNGTIRREARFGAADLARGRFGVKTFRRCLLGKNEGL